MQAQGSICHSVMQVSSPKAAALPAVTQNADDSTIAASCGTAEVVCRMARVRPGCGVRVEAILFANAETHVHTTAYTAQASRNDLSFRPLKGFDFDFRSLTVRYPTGVCNMKEEVKDR